jgi:hypothetical protein
MSDLDPRWDWIEVTEFGSPGPEYMKGACKHLETTPVYSRDALDRQLDWDVGTPVAHLCLTCNAQLPPEWDTA